MSNQRKDIGIIGGGLVGLATALRLAERWPAAHITVLEKEPGVGRHQSGHNSNVIHSGIYYRPGSQKARLCRQGKRALESFCAEQSVPVNRIGKLIVAVSPDELPGLGDLLQRGRANGVECHRISSDEAADLEPQVHAVSALWVPETSIVDYSLVMDRMADHLRGLGHDILLSAPVRRIGRSGEGIVLETPGRKVTCDLAVNCAGLFSDALARMAGAKPGLRIVGFRGEYLRLGGPLESSIHHLVYPVPDARFPFLGVHLTPTVDGKVLCGPNAVLALAREGYRWGDIDPAYLLRTLAYSGMIRLGWRYWPKGLGEVWRSWNRGAFTRSLRRMLPGVNPEDLTPDGAGVRAQALLTDGRLMDDFSFLETDRMVHLVNAPSPAATACLAIGDVVVDRLEQLA